MCTHRRAMHIIMFMRFVCANVCPGMIRTQFHLNSQVHTHTHKCTHTHTAHQTTAHADIVTPFPHPPAPQLASCTRSTLIYSAMGSYSFGIIQFTVPSVSEAAGSIDRTGAFWFCNMLSSERLGWQLGLVFGGTCIHRGWVR